MKTFFFLLLIAFSINLNGQTGGKSFDTIHVFSAKYYKLKDTLAKPIDVSFEKLLQHPKKYDRKYIRVVAFLHIELPYSLLFKSSESYAKNEKSNSIIFLLHKEDCYVISQKYNDLIVAVSGIFNIYNEKKMIYDIQKVDAIK